MGGYSIRRRGSTDDPLLNYDIYKSIFYGNEWIWTMDPDLKRWTDWALNKKPFKSMDDCLVENGWLKLMMHEKYRY